MVFFLRDNEPKINDGAYVISLDDKKVMEHIGFCYSLTKTWLFTLILLELNIFRKKY